MKTAYWHPFADMAQVATKELMVTSGDGVWITDQNGKKYLDATASLWYCNVGYNRPEIVQAVTHQLQQLPAYSNFGIFTTESTRNLAELIVELSPLPNASVFFTCDGSEAIDTAAKLARRYWDIAGFPERRTIVSRSMAYHGMNAWGTELQGIQSNREGFGGTIVDAVVHLATDEVGEFESLAEQHGAEIAAFIGEPVQGAGGVRPPREGYWKAIAELCAAHGIIVIADEVITGFGRLGSWFASPQFELKPDMIAFAKGVTSGYLPLGGVVMGTRVRDLLWEQGGMLRHGYTYSGHATSCAAAIANIEILHREGLVARVAELAPTFGAILGQLSSHPLVGCVRTAGLLAGVELDGEAVGADPYLPQRVVDAALEEGVATRVLAGATLQISPAFVISEAEIDHLVERLNAALDTCAATAGERRS